MKFLNIIFKAKGKKVVLEFALIFSIFMISFFSFTYFIGEYKTEWNGLVRDSSNPDFEVSLNLNNSQFFNEYNSLNQHFNDLNHKLITSLPRNLIDLFIDNISIDSVSLFVVNSKLNLENTYIIDDETAALIVKDSSLPDIGDIQIDWRLNTSLDFFNVSQVVGESYFTELLGTVESYYVLQETSIYNIIIRDIDFFSFANGIGISEIKKEINQERIKLFSLYFMNKTSYLKLLPVKLRNEYNEWVTNIEIESYTFFASELTQNEFYFEFSFNDIFLGFLEETIQKIRFVFFNSLIFSALVSIFFLYFLYIVIHQDRKEQITHMNVLSSRGVKIEKIHKLTFLFQSIIAGVSLCTSVSVSWVFLFAQQLQAYTLFQLISSLSHLCIFLSVVLIIQLTTAEQKDEKTQIVEDDMKKLSKSQLFNLGLQIGMVLLILVSFTTFWTINSMLVESTQLSVGTIWYIVMGLILITGCLIVMPRIQISILHWSIRKITKHFTPAFDTIARTFTSISKKKRRILSISFYLLLFSTIFMTSFASLQNQKNDLNESLRIYDYSLITEPETSSKIFDICGYNNCLVSFVDQVFTFDGTINIIYFDNPLKYYENSFFKTVKFEKHPNLEVFEQLNSSSTYVISSNILTEKNQYFISENITIPRTLYDLSIEYDINTLFDYSYYLPFYSLNDPVWFLKKYEESQHNLTNFQYSITSIKRQNSNIEEVFNYLESKGIWYAIKHDETDEDLSYNSRDIFLLQLYNSAIIVNTILPVFLIGLLGYFIFDTNKYFSYLKVRGLKNKDIRKSQAIWLFMFLFLIFTVGILCTFIILGLVFYTHNSLYSFPIKLVFSWKSILTFIVPLILVLILIFTSDSTKLKRIKDRKKQKTK